MADTLQLVTRSAGGRPIVLMDLHDLSTTFLVQETFDFQPGPKTQQMSTRQRRRGGSHQVGETQDNATVSWAWLVKGSTYDQVAQNVENVLAQAEATLGATDRFIKWKPQGGSFPTYFEQRGTATWKPTYKYLEYLGAMSMAVQVQWPVAPLAEWDPLDIGDDFSVDSISDYTFDSGGGTAAVSGGQLTATNTSAKQFFHSARGYKYADFQETIKVVIGATATGSVRIGKRIDANNQLLAIVTSSDVTVYKNAGGTLTLLSSAGGSPLAIGATFWLRFRTEGNVVFAEAFTTQPTPTSTPARSASTTLAGGDATQFGAGITGNPVVYWAPSGTDWTLDDLTVEPYTYRNKTLPLYQQLGGAIPGDAPARADLVVTPSGGSAAPIWALAAWATRPGTPLSTAVAPFGQIEAETDVAADRTSWAVTADATMSGGSCLKDTSASSAKAYTASWLIDPATLTPDDFTAKEVAVEVWAAVIMSSTLVTPKLTLSVRPEDGLTFGAERFTDEWGSTGKVATAPSSGTVRRLVRLGTIQAYCDPLRPRRWKLWLAGALGSASSGTFGVDVLLLAPAKQVACGESSVANDGTNRIFVASTAETTKTIRSDLSGMVAKPPANGHPDTGLGGQLLELPAGQTDALVKLSSLVPDDPTVDATTEQLFHTATVHIAVTPRSFLLRGS